MGHTKLTDTSNGYRALRVSMLDDIAYRLVQPQYQTAELLIIAMKRGWRVSEEPTVWLPAPRARPRRARTGSSASATGGSWPRPGGRCARSRTTEGAAAPRRQ